MTLSVVALDLFRASNVSLYGCHRLRRLYNCRRLPATAADLRFVSARQVPTRPKFTVAARLEASARLRAGSDLVVQVARGGVQAGIMATATPLHSPSPCRYRNRMACNAWFCVAALTRRSTARCVRNALTSASDISAGCRRSWYRMKRRIQSQYAVSVRGL